MPLSRSIENELGHPGVSGSAGTGWSGPGVNQVTGQAWIDDPETTPELMWPRNIPVLDLMRRTDAQVAAVLRAIVLPAMRRARWRLGTDGADPRVVAACRRTLGLEPEQRARPSRRARGVVWGDYLRTGLIGKLVYGHAVFEQVYRIGPPPPDVPGLPLAMAHLHKLAPRPARSIADWIVHRDGSLIAVRQYAGAGVGTTAAVGRHGSTVDLPIERLVVHVHEMEDANWRGLSLLRASYKHWLIKDQLLRLGPMAVERNGMGLPVVTFDPQIGSRAEAIRIARMARAGDDAGVALPEGYTLQLVGVTGSTKDELPLVNYHDQAIGRNALAMHLSLGHDGGLGQGGLGDTFAQLFALALNAEVEAFAQDTTEYVLSDFVELNFGPDEPVPPVLVDELEPEQALTPEAIKNLVDSGVVLPDDALEEEIRRRYRLPGLPHAAPDGPPDFRPDGGVDEIPQPPVELPPMPVDPAPAPGVPAPQPEGSGTLIAGYTPDELLRLVNAAAALIRSGFQPDAALIAVGLDPIEHLGLLPVTVQKPAQPVAGLAAARWLGGAVPVADASAALLEASSMPPASRELAALSARADALQAQIEARGGQHLVQRRRPVPA